VVVQAVKRKVQRSQISVLHSSAIHRWYEDMNHLRSRRAGHPRQCLYWHRLPLKRAAPILSGGVLAVENQPISSQNLKTTMDAKDSASQQMAIIYVHNLKTEQERKMRWYSHTYADPRNGADSPVLRYFFFGSDKSSSSRL
jgi:hypothetical protein